MRVLSSARKSLRDPAHLVVEAISLRMVAAIRQIGSQANKYVHWLIARVDVKHVPMVSLLVLPMYALHAILPARRAQLQVILISARHVQLGIIWLD